MEEQHITVTDLIGYVAMLACVAAIAPYAWKGLWLLIRIGWAWYCFGR